MKRIFPILLALALLFLAGCDSSGTEEEREVDTARSFTRSYKNVLAAETKDTIYYIGEHDNFIKYVDKATGITGALCGRPDCKHNNETCNAYTNGPDCLFINAGRLYWVCDSMDNFKTCSLYSAALDGTGRREELVIDRELLGNSFSNRKYFILHEDCLYFGAIRDEIENGEDVNYTYIRAFPLDSPEESFVILQERAKVNSNLNMQFYGDGLYMTTNNRAGATEEGRFLWNFQLRRWSAESRELETLYEDLNSPFFWTMDLWVTDESVYFDRDNFSTIYRYDFETGECGPRFDHGVSGLGIYIADNIVTGFQVTNHGGGSYDLHVAIEDFEGNSLVDDTYAFQLDCPYYTDWSSQFLGRDEEYAYYALHERDTEEDVQHQYTTVIQAALDGSGARELCSFVEDHMIS